MKSLSEMTTGELTTLKARTEEMVRDQVRAGRPARDLANFRNAIDDELWKRGA